MKKKEYIKKYISIYNLIKFKIGVSHTNKSKYCTKDQLKKKLAPLYNLSFPDNDNTIWCEFLLQCVTNGDHSDLKKRFS